jgi:Domain of unknown function (DUF4272)
LDAIELFYLSLPKSHRDIIRMANAGRIGEGVPFLATLPVIETAAEALHRSKEEVALRTLCLQLVAAKGGGLRDEVVEGILEDYELRPHLTPEELTFVLDNSPSQHDRTKFSWRHEAAWTLLWALGFVPQLGKPAQIL